MDIPPFELLKDVADTLMIPLVIFGMKVMWSMSRLIQKMHQTLYGATGQNGMRYDVRQLRDDVTDHHYRLKQLEGVKHGQS